MKYADQETIGKLAELDMIVAELERANNRVAAAERRNVCDVIVTWVTETDRPYKYAGTSPPCFHVLTTTSIVAY